MESEYKTKLMELGLGNTCFALLYGKKQERKEARKGRCGKLENI